MRQRADLIAIAAHLQTGDLLEARSLAAKVAAASPGDAALYGALGALFQGGGQLDEAAAWFEEALALAPDNTAAAINLARIQAERGQVDAGGATRRHPCPRTGQCRGADRAGAARLGPRRPRRRARSKLERARAADPADAKLALRACPIPRRQRQGGPDAVAVAQELVAIAPAVALPHARSAWRCSSPASRARRCRTSSARASSTPSRCVTCSTAPARTLALGELEPARASW
jgi:cellulose synthase operon protein C